MPKFGDLPYGGNELTCRNCNEKVFFASFNRFRYETGVEYQWGYQCQDCGALTMSELNEPNIPFLEKRCACGGQFRNDKPLFCANCKYNKTSENISEA